MKASSKRPRVESSTGDASWLPPSSDPSTKAYVDPIAIVDPLLSTSGDFSLRGMLDTVMTIQAVHGQLLLDVLNELHALLANLTDVRGSTPQAPPFNES